MRNKKKPFLNMEGSTVNNSALKVLNTLPTETSLVTETSFTTDCFSIEEIEEVTVPPHRYATRFQKSLIEL